ncbi:Double-stranded RNA-binding protein [Corchorus capsularis]|uniref:Small RNA 2'-O-methyltransferase n=1 Tax=Corchorus capsularis TaxID=210143 RepID=A0A1R3IKW3_COCAP|nr:Double-stranded RNA-binding protein [Corchorus capsularis]
METGGSLPHATRKPTLTPKAIIHQKYGNKASYKVEEVEEPAQNGCPGLAILQKGPCLYRCTLELPEFSVTSESFKKKKDAEQSAAQMALDKLGIRPSADNPTAEEAWTDLIARIEYIFSNEFLSALHPLSGHLKAALGRVGDLNGSVPASVIAICDGKPNNLCKIINPKMDSQPFLVISYIMRAATRLPELVVGPEGQLSIRRKNPYPPDLIESILSQESGVAENVTTMAIYIPCSTEKPVEPVILNISSSSYYLDVIAQKLGLSDANKVLISRTIGKASSETRFYLAAPKSFPIDIPSDHLNDKALKFGEPLNARASYICGQNIYGDSILASIGYTWKSQDLFHEDVTLQSYYRMVISKIPSGLYKLSREAILAAELPLTFTTRTNWKGSFPREILCSFCRQHRLLEPVFSISTIPTKASSELSRSSKKLKVSESADQDTEYADGDDTVYAGAKSVGLASSFSCEVKLYSKSQDLILVCAPNVLYKKQNDAVQNASLKVLSWLNAYFKDTDMPLEKLKQLASVFDINFYPQNFIKEVVSCLSVNSFQHSETFGGKPESNGNNILNGVVEDAESSIDTEGLDSGVCPSNGSLLCVCYSVSLVTKDKLQKELLESAEEFEFEIGTGAVITSMEAIGSQMSVGQSACFHTELPPQDLVLAAAKDSPSALALLSSPCCLEYSIILLRLTEPPEDRMEQALFSPPLSKQRVEYAVQHIKDSCATSLVDFGCGSGSLLESLLDYPTSLETIVGVDISQKSLSRAAKVLHSKLTMNSDPDAPSRGIKSAVLYDGSITDFDSRLCGFDLGTCLEVIEHMEEEQACMFGDVVLSSFRPRVLIVSTPNYEYNVILQGSNITSQEDDPEEKVQSQSCKFRNHDHKFEWTREQFNHWASNLAVRHNYTVKFSGVGGSADVEPGFASQIAVFRRVVLPEEENLQEHKDLECKYNVIWKWNRSNPALTD